MYVLTSLLCFFLSSAVGYLNILEYHFHFHGQNSSGSLHLSMVCPAVQPP